jgi:hypothetical protein
MDIIAIDIEHIVEALRPLWDGAHSSARSTLSRIEAVLATAIVRKWRKNANIAAWKVFKHVAPKRPGGDDEDRRHAMIPWPEAPAVIAKIRSVDIIAARALTFAVLTCVPISEATRGISSGTA